MSTVVSLPPTNSDPENEVFSVLKCWRVLKAAALKVSEASPETSGSVLSSKVSLSMMVEALAKPLAISAYGGHREGFWKEKMPV